MRRMQQYSDQGLRSSNGQDEPARLGRWRAAVPRRDQDGKGWHGQGLAELGNKICCGLTTHLHNCPQIRWHSQNFAGLVPARS